MVPYYYSIKHETTLQLQCVLGSAAVSSLNSFLRNIVKVFCWFTARRQVTVCIAVCQHNNHMYRMKQRPIQPRPLCRSAPSVTYFIDAGTLLVLCIVYRLVYNRYEQNTDLRSPSGDLKTLPSRSPLCK